MPCHVSLFGIKRLWDGIHAGRIIRFNIRCSSGQETIWRYFALVVGASDVSWMIWNFFHKSFKTKVIDKDVVKFINLGENLIPKISEIGNFRKQNEFSTKIKLGGWSWKGIDSEPFSIQKKVKMEIPSFTVKNRLKSLQIEYYSTALLSKLDTHNLRRSLLNYRNPLKLIFSNPF